LAQRRREAAQTEERISNMTMDPAKFLPHPTPNFQTSKIIFHLNIVLPHVWCHTVFDTAKCLFTSYQEKEQKDVIVIYD
jgi:hypothetical protein